MKLGPTIARLERKLAITYQEYKREHPGTHKEPSDPLFNDIGKTESGKTVYNHFEHPEHTQFNFKDHLDAAKVHMDEAKASGDKEHHLSQAKQHTNAADKQIMEGLDVAGI